MLPNVLIELRNDVENLQKTISEIEKSVKFDVFAKQNNKGIKL